VGPEYSLVLGTPIMSPREIPDSEDDSSSEASWSEFLLPGAAADDTANNVANCGEPEPPTVKGVWKRGWMWRNGATMPPLCEVFEEDRLG
jgi:hypothetical protein